MYSGGSWLSVDIHFVDLEVSYDILSIVLSTTLIPYIEIATVISDNIFARLYKNSCPDMETFMEYTHRLILELVVLSVLMKPRLRWSRKS